LVNQNIAYKKKEIIMTYIAAVFFIIGACDYLIGNKLGLGESFYEGLSTIVELLFLMTGFMALSPWIKSVLGPAITPFFLKIGCDPSLFAGMLLSCDSGGAVLGKAMAVSQTAGLYNGMVVGAFLGINIMITIPLVLENTKGGNQKAASKGMLIGFVTLPFGCVITGLIAGFKLSLILANTWPVLILSLFLLFLFKLCGDHIVTVFKVFSFIISAIALTGFTIDAVQSTLGITIVKEMTPLNEIFPVICNIGVFLAGILPFMTRLQKLLKKPFGKIARTLKVNDRSVISFLICATNPIPSMVASDRLDVRGCFYNVAFLTPACFACGDFLAFSMQFKPSIAMPLMIGKLITGFISLAIAIAIGRRSKTLPEEIPRADVMSVSAE
jgi:ethanolamine transporter